MSLLNQHREELLSMATGEVDEETHRKLQDLIHTNPECREYWKEITQLTRQLKADAASSESGEPTPWFHARVRKSILAESDATRSGIGSRTRSRSWLWKFALLAPVAILSVCVVVFMVIRQAAPADPRNLVVESDSKPLDLNATLTVFQQAVHRSPESFDELLNTMMLASHPTNQMVVYRALDARNGELP